MSLINIENPKVQNPKMRRNFEGPRLLVHKIQYEILPDGMMKTAHIVAQNFLAAERLLISEMDGGPFKVISYSDSEFEICAFTPEIEKALYKMFQNKYDSFKKKMRK
jgi:hypothetical protein